MKRWCNKLIFFYKSITSLFSYLSSYLDFPSQINHPLRSVSASVIKPLLSRTKSFKNAFSSRIETTEHFLLGRHLYFSHRTELFENLDKVDSSFLNLNVKIKSVF